MSNVSERVVIVGAGHAGGSAAALLRQYGWQGPITLIGAEPVPPYQRPPLSKAWLKGEGNLADLLLRPAAFYPASRHRPARLVPRDSNRPCSQNREPRERRAFGLRPSDPGDRRACAVASCPGPRPRGRRRIAHACRRRPPEGRCCGPGARIAIIGGGYIGLEVAASARMLGAEVVVIERESRVLRARGVAAAGGVLPAAITRTPACASS